jgi:6-phospho-beta-glucosidase
MLDYATLIKELAPNAYLINFTNPAGIITEALQEIIGDRVLGICDTPSGLGRRVASVLGLDHDKVQMDYVGLNHLGWMRRVLYEGQDILPAILADDRKLGALEEGQIFGSEWIRALGVIPNEYLYYYYFNRDAVRNVLASPSTRADFLEKTQGQFFRELASKHSNPIDLWRMTDMARSASYMAEAKGGTQDNPTHPGQTETDPSHQGYAGVALGVMRAISRNEPETFILNVRNRGTIGGLPDDAVVEVPTMVDANGVHPLSTEAPTLDQIGLMQQVKAVERHIIAAAVHGDRNEALKAFALHPLVDSVNTGRQLLTGYADSIPAIATTLGLTGSSQLSRSGF